MPDYDTWPANGFDRADGAAPGVGTPTPAGAAVIFPSSYVFEELATSPQIERGEQYTIKHQFNCDLATGFIAIQGLPRGTFFEDSYGHVTRVLTTNLDTQKPNMAVLSITGELVFDDSPPDEFEIDTIEINPSIEKHPRYQILTDAERFYVRSAVDSPTFNTQGSWVAKVNDISDPDHQAAAAELLTKYHKGEDVFYLPGFRIVWSQYFWYPPNLDCGGYTQDPIVGGALPYTFWSDDGTPDGGSIFEDFATLNPQLFGQGISWLRLADTLHLQRTWYRVQHTWLGAPYAHWDADIYSNADNPYLP